MDNVHRPVFRGIKKKKKKKPSFAPFSECFSSIIIKIRSYVSEIFATLYLEYKSVTRPK